MSYTQGIWAIRGEGTVGTHGGDNRLRRHILGQPCRESRRNPGGGDRVILTCSRGWGETVGAGGWGFIDAGTETGNSQVGG